MDVVGNNAPPQKKDKTQKEMKKKLYMAPSIQTVDIEIVSVIAGSISEEGKGDISNPSEGTGSTKKYVSSSTYFDSWDDTDDLGDDTDF